MRENNKSLHLIPQIIAGNPDEMANLCDVLQKEGYNEINLNMGCPAPMQTKHNRGSSLLTDEKSVRLLVEEMNRRRDVDFSVKMAGDTANIKRSAIVSYCYSSAYCPTAI